MVFILFNNTFRSLIFSNSGNSLYMFCGNSNEFGTLPSDKQLYYLEAGYSFKAASGQLDGEAGKWLGMYEAEIKASDTLSGDMRARALGALYDMRGDFEVLSGGSSEAALEHFSTSFDVAVATRNKLLAVSKFLSLLYARQLQSERQPEFEAYFRARHSALDATDYAGVPQFREMRQALLSN